MPDLNLLLLPLLGAYFLVAYTNLFYYNQLQLDRQRLIFSVFLIAFLLLVASFTITSVLKTYYPEFSDTLVGFIPIKEKWIGTSLVAFLLAVGLSLALNLFIGRSRSLARAVRKHGDAFQNLLLDALLSRELLMVSLKNNKVYIGFVDRYPPGGLELPYFEITPVLSGYRDADDNTLKISTDYSKAYESLLLNDEADEDGDISEDISEIVLTVNIEELVSASPFNSSVFRKMNPSDSRKKEVDPELESTS